MTRRSAGAWPAWGVTIEARSLAAWLLVAVAAHLLLTRTLVRLVIFMPKSPVMAGVAQAMGWLAAAVDALVPVLGLLLLAVLLLNGGRTRAPLSWRAGLAFAAAVAAGGLALLLVPPVPSGQLVVDALLLVSLGALCLPALRAMARPAGPDVMAWGLSGFTLLAVAGAASLAALARGVDAAGALGGGPGGPSLTIWLRAAGELAYLAGATLFGLAGLNEAARGRAVVRPRWIAVAAVAVVALLGASLAAPLSLGILLMWSLGLSGTFPVFLYAAVAAVAIAGGSALAGARREAAFGLAIALLAGYTLAASGLVLATLLGLALAVPAIAGAGKAAARPADRGRVGSERLVAPVAPRG